MVARTFVSRIKNCQYIKYLSFGLVDTPRMRSSANPPNGFFDCIDAQGALACMSLGWNST